jgi:hypothetical protein
LSNKANKCCWRSMINRRANNQEQCLLSLHYQQIVLLSTLTGNISLF